MKCQALPSQRNAQCMRHNRSAYRSTPDNDLYFILQNPVLGLIDG